MNIRNGQQQKNVFAVIGIGRSGTSVIARSLKTLGIDLGKKLLPGDARNPKGFWEDSDILYRINRGVSHALGEPWTTFGKLDQQIIDNNPTLKCYQLNAISILQDRLKETDNWGFKDPRTTTILAFWQCVFKSLKVQDHYIIAVRNPLAVAYSHLHFAKTDLEMGLLLWLTHLFTAIEGTQGRKRVVVSYESMLKNPHKELKRMRSAFSLPRSLNPKEVDTFAHEFLDTNLTHHQFTEAEFKHHAIVSVLPLSVKIYDLLMNLAKDEIHFESDNFRKEWKHIQEEFALAYPLYQYLRLQLKRQNSLERELRKIHQSFIWKFTYPLIKLMNSVRVMRRKSKEANRMKGLTTTS